MTDLAARVMANEVERLREKLSHAQYLIQHGWECMGPFHWKDWQTGKVYRARVAYEMELDRQEECDRSQKTAG